MLGGGSFGTALAQHMAQQGCKVTLWARDGAVAAAINRSRHNPRYLSTFALHQNLQASADLSAAVSDAELIVVGLPSRALRACLQAALPTLQARSVQPAYLVGTKGLEGDTLLTMHELCLRRVGRACRSAGGVAVGPQLCS